MKLEVARTLADAVMMEGYALYPFRASAPKNRFRWTFGVLAPRAWSDAGGCESSWCQIQVLVAGAPERILGQLRFFQIERRRVVEASEDRIAVDWDEGVDQMVELDVAQREVPFTIAAAHTVEQLASGRIARERLGLTGRVTMRREAVASGLERITIRIENTTPFANVGAPREEALAATFASTHVILGVTSGELLSVIDPPAWARDAASACENTGLFPVLVGQPGSHDVMLAAPFVLYDHAQLAPESAGDFCDATEIDELLTLRTQTLTDAEKREARATDPRAAAIIDRCDRLPDARLARMHGATRALVAGEMMPRPVYPLGAKVRLRPSIRRTDAQDLIYAGHIATVAAIRHDVDGSTFLAVTIDDDPAAELHDWYGRYHYYRIEEVESV